MPYRFFRHLVLCQVKLPHEQDTKQDGNPGQWTALQIQDWRVAVCYLNGSGKINYVLLHVWQTPTALRNDDTQTHRKIAGGVCTEVPIDIGNINRGLIR